MPVLSNSRHEKFAQEIAKGSSASAAFVAAGYSKNDGNASRLNGNEKVRARVEELLLASAERVGITRERIQTELAKIAFSDIRKAVKWRSGLPDGDFKLDAHDNRTPSSNEVQLFDSDKLDDGTAAAISEIAQTRDGALKLKMYDKQKALELLGKDIGMFKDRIEHSGQAVTFTWLPPVQK